MKRFVHEAVDETLKLGSALARLRTPYRVAMVHYAPILETVEGEPRGDLPVPRLEPAGGADRPVSRLRGVSRPRAQRPARGTYARRRARCTTWRCRCCGGTIRTSPPFRLFTIDTPGAHEANVLRWQIRPTYSRAARWTRDAAARNLQVAAEQIEDHACQLRGRRPSRCARHTRSTGRRSDAWSGRGFPFLVGGAYAFARYTGIERFTKDFDVFVRPEDLDRLLGVLARRRLPDRANVQALAGEGVRRRRLPRPDLQLGQRRRARGRRLVRPRRRRRGPRPAREAGGARGDDLVEELHHGARAVRRRRRGAPPARRAPSRSTGRGCVSRFGGYWRVLFSHLVLFGFIYPSERARIPLWVMEQLTERLASELRTSPPAEPVCQGTILSRQQYLPDVERWGYIDARVFPRGHMSPGGDGGMDRGDRRRTIERLDGMTRGNQRNFFGLDSPDSEER